MTTRASITKAEIVRGGATAAEIMAASPEIGAVEVDFRAGKMTIYRQGEAPSPSSEADKISKSLGMGS